MNFNFSKTVKFFIALGIQVLILLVMILLKVSTLTGGKEVFLKLTPVDPRDPIRGDYMVLNYEISRIPKFYFLDKNVLDGETVYVPLYKTGKYWTMTSGVTKTKPEKSSETQNDGIVGLGGSKNDFVYIKGVVTSGGNNSSAFGEQQWGFGGDNITVKYNIESYFIPEGKGSTWPFGSQNAFAQVMVDDSGTAVLKKVYIDDKPWP